MGSGSTCTCLMKNARVFPTSAAPKVRLRLSMVLFQKGCCSLEIVSCDVDWCRLTSFVPVRLALIAFGAEKFHLRHVHYTAQVVVVAKNKPHPGTALAC